MSLGKRLKARLADLGMNQKELAEKLNISQSTLNGYFNDYREPDFNTLRDLTKILDCSIAYLLGEIDEPNIKITRDTPVSTSPSVKSTNTDDPGIVTIQRLRKNMPPVDREKMMKLLRITFDEFFPKENNDDDDVQE